MKPTVHQLVHGYSRGHALLASSVQLPKSSLEVVTEQSDLSGPLPSGVSIPCYLAAYPVPDTSFYALARSWADNDAPRLGCVITHTLLIPKDTWGTVLSPSAFLRLHKQPDRQSLTTFKTPIQIPETLGKPESNDTLTHADAYEFSSKVFSEGLRSVVWFDCADADRLVLSFAAQLWPSLRNSLYAHTFSLQPYAKVKCDLQLHFAPRNAQSYFSRIPKQCQMGRRHSNNRNEPESEWIRELSEDLCAGIPRDSYLYGLKRFGHLLGSEPSTVRNLFALRDLTDRLPSTPTAAIGILDIIDSLEPEAEQAVEEKRLALDMALSAALQAEVATSLQCLTFIDARLRRTSFSIASFETKASLKDSVAEIATRDPRALLNACVQIDPLEDSAFWQGVIKGLRVAAETRPSSIETLGSSPQLAAFVVRDTPIIARAYLHSNPPRRTELITDVVQWINHAERDEQRRLIREVLIPEAYDDASVPLLEELLRDIRDSDVSHILDELVESTQGFAKAALRRVVVDFVCQRFPEEAVDWGRNSQLLQSRFVPEVIAEAFTLAPDGLDRLLAIRWRSSEDRCEVWSAFIERAAKKRLPQWFIRRAAEDPAMIEPFAKCLAWSTRTVHALKAIAEQCDYVPIAIIDDVASFVQRIVDTELAERFIPIVLDSAIGEYVRGRIDTNQMLRVLDTIAVEKWREYVTASRIHSLLTSPSDGEAWQRSWITVALLPHTLFVRVASHQLILDFIRSFRANWNKDVENAWSQILMRAQAELSDDVALRLHMESIAFCLSHPRLPVGHVLCSAFPSVYDAVSANIATHVTDEMFGYFDWDKAKRLRRDVIDAFMVSSWPPEQLALIGSRCKVLRKIVHRIQRKWGGEDYIRRILEGLRSMESVEAASVAGEVATMFHDPDFFEPWD